MSAIRLIESCRILHDGTLGSPRLLHPEGVAVDTDGNVWCGGELGHIYRISPEGGTLAEVACTGGFILGIAFDATGRIYACDLGHRAVFRLDPGTGVLERFADLGARGATGPPNFPVVDVRRNALYVSESVRNGGGVWRFDLDSGEGGRWLAGPMDFANGMCLTPDGDALLLAETFGRRILRIPIRADGAPGEPETVVETPDVLPDGLALDIAGNLYVACYEPSQILRLTPSGVLETFVADPDAHTLCHPTNTAFRGTELLIANLGRWHITAIDTDHEGVALPVC